MINYLRSIERSEKAYLIGLCLLFIGLAIKSLPTALTVVGAVVAAESVVTSYLATYFSGKV
jgi:hypothetical protein